MPFFQHGSCSFFSCPVLSEIFHICMAEADPEPFPVMAVIKFQAHSIFFFCILTVHHITVEYRYGMIITHQLRPAAFLIRFFPQFHPCLIWGYTSQGMLDSCPSEIRRHLWKSQVKIKPCLVLFGGMHQMFCRVETFFRFRDYCQFIPCLSIDPNQTTDRRTINIQCLADRYILFSQFYAITGYYPHLFSFLQI